MSESINSNFDHRQVKPKSPQVQELINSCKSIMLATINQDGTPLVSTAPYSRVDNEFQILVSYMAKHTLNLQERNKVSIMFVEDEANCKQIYARHRLTLQVNSELVAKDTLLYQRALEDLKARNGKIIDVLESLEDFVLFNFKIQSGSYVNGFGSAYYVNPQLEIVEHRIGEHTKDNIHK
ncbi:HugZ family pyridoxamine 5'-phosphate oxidase [Myroides sp. LJL119]